MVSPCGPPKDDLIALMEAYADDLEWVSDNESISPQPRLQYSSDQDCESLPNNRALSYDPSQLTHNSCGLPINGHDYLKLVQEERRNLPAVVSIKKPPPPPAPLKARADHNESQSCVFFEKDQTYARKNEAGDCTSRDQSLALSFDSSEQSSTPDELGEPNPREQLGIEPLASTSLYLHNNSSDSNCEASSQADVSMATSEVGILNKSNCSIMSSSVFREKIRLKSTLFTSGDTSSTLVKNHNKPSLGSKSIDDPEYCGQLLQRFRELRSNISKERATSIHDGQAKIYQQAMLNDQEKKSEEEREQERQLLSRGRKIAEVLVQRALSRMNMGLAPPLSDLLQMDQLAIHLALEKLADRYERTSSYSTLHADWIYSLMACLHEPIDADICSTLRRLARFCITRRDLYEKRLVSGAAARGNKSEVIDMDCDLVGVASRKSQASNRVDASDVLESMDKEEYLACILIICIVHHIFGQTDLK